MGNHFSRMGCCHADDDEHGDFSKSAARPLEEKTPIAASLKPHDLHIIERQPESNNEEKTHSFETINVLLASPTKICAHSKNQNTNPPVNTANTKPPAAVVGFGEDPMIRELKERFKNRTLSKHLSIEDGSPDRNDRQPILSKKQGTPLKAYVSYTTEQGQLDQPDYMRERISNDQFSHFAREEIPPFMEVNLSPVIEVNPTVAKIIETKPEATQNCVCLEQPKRLITANVDPPEEIHESVLVDIANETILDNLRNQSLNVQEEEENNHKPKVFDYVNEAFKHSSGSLHKEEKTVIKRDSNGGFKVFKECIISTLVHNNEAFTDSSQSLTDKWDTATSYDDYSYHRTTNNSNEPKFQISTNSSYTALDEDKMVQVRVVDNPLSEEAYDLCSFDQYPNITEKQQLLPRDTHTYLWEDDDEHDADDEETFLESTPPIHSKRNCQLSTDSETACSTDLFLPDSDSSHDSLTPENKLIELSSPTNLSDFADKTVSSCIDNAQKCISNYETSRESFRDYPLKSFGKYILSKKVSFEDESANNNISCDYDTISDLADLPLEAETTERGTSFENVAPSVSSTELSSVPFPSDNAEDEEKQVDRKDSPNGKVYDKDVLENNDQQENDNEFPSPPEEFLDFRELLEKEGFSKEEFIGVSETGGELLDLNEENIYFQRDASHSLDISEDTNLLTNLNESRFLVETVSHSSGYDDHTTENERISLLDNNEQLLASYDSDSFQHGGHISYENDLLDQSATSDYYSSGDRDHHFPEFSQLTLKCNEKKFSVLEGSSGHSSQDDITDADVKASATHSSFKKKSQTSHSSPLINRSGSFEFEDIAKDLSSFKRDISLNSDTDASCSSPVSDVRVDLLSKVRHPSPQKQNNLKEKHHGKSSDSKTETKLPRMMSHELECFSTSDPEEKKVILEPDFGYPIAKTDASQKPGSELEKESTKNISETNSEMILESDETTINIKHEINEKDISDSLKDSSRFSCVKVSDVIMETMQLKESENNSYSVDNKTPITKDIFETKEILAKSLKENEDQFETHDGEPSPSPKLRRQSTLKTSEMFSMALMEELQEEPSAEDPPAQPECSISSEIPKIIMTSPTGSATPSSLSSSQTDLACSSDKETPATQQIFSLRFRQPAADYVTFRNRLETTYVSLENVLLRNNIILGTVKIKPMGNKRYVFLRCSFNLWETAVDIPATHTPSSFPNQYETFSFALTMPVSFEEIMHVVFAVCYESDDQTYWDNNDSKNYEIVSTHTIQQEMLSKFRSSETEAVLPKCYPSVLKKGATSFSSNSSWDVASTIKETKHIRKSAICLNVSKPTADYVTFKSRLERDFVALEHVFNKDFMLTGSIKVKNLNVKKTVFIRCSFDGWKTCIDVPASLSNTEYTYPYETYTFEMNVPTVFNTKMQFAVCYQAGNNVYWDNNGDKNYQICFFDMYAKMQVDPWKGQ